jgi:hypothetical protein
MRLAAASSESRSVAALTRRYPRATRRPCLSETLLELGHRVGIEAAVVHPVAVDAYRHAY